MKERNPFAGLGAREPVLRDGLGKAARLRELLQQYGPMRAPQLARLADMPAAHVRHNILHDVRIGRVLREDATYSLAPGWEPVTPLIGRAIALLQRHGYKITKPR